jgi:hypothetical protein
MSSVFNYNFPIEKLQFQLSKVGIHEFPFSIILSSLCITEFSYIKVFIHVYTFLFKSKEAFLFISIVYSNRIRL